MLSFLAPTRGHFRPLESFLEDRSAYPVSWDWRPSVVRRAPTEHEMRVKKLQRMRQRVAALQSAEQEAADECERLERLQQELAYRQEFLTARKSEIEEERIQVQKAAEALHAELLTQQQAELQQARERRLQELEQRRRQMEEYKQLQAKVEAAASVNVVAKERKPEAKASQEDKTGTKELGLMEVGHTDDRLTLNLAVPGVSKDGLRLSVKGDAFGKALHISGRRTTENAGIVRTSEFFRSVPLPSHTTAADVSAELDEAAGSLKVTVQLPSESKVAQNTDANAKAAPSSESNKVVEALKEHKATPREDVPQAEAESGAKSQELSEPAEEQDVALSIMSKLDDKTREVVEQYVFVGDSDDSTANTSS